MTEPTVEKSVPAPEMTLTPRPTEDEVDRIPPPAPAAAAAAYIIPQNNAYIDPINVNVTLKTSVAGEPKFVASSQKHL